MRGVKTCLLLLLFGVGFFCCQKSPEASYPAIIEAIDGVQIVTNPNYPRDGIVQDILEEELSVGLEEGPEEYMFNRPFDVQAADDGTIFVLDWGDVCIKVYDKEGTYLRTIGQAGQGPGDFGFLLYFALSQDGRILVMNPVNRQVSVFNVSGEYLGGYAIEGVHNEMKIDGRDRIYYSRSKRKTDEELPVTEDFLEIEKIVQIFRNETDGQDLFLIGEFEGEKDRIKITGSESSIGLSSEFSVVWDINREGLLYEGFNQDYIINVFDQEGKKTLSFGRDYQPVTKEFGPEDNLRKRTMPAFDPRVGWAFDGEGNLWVSIYSEKEGEVIYDVFSPEGIYIKQAILPCRICQIKGDKLYSIVTTEEGYMAVKRFSLKGIK